MARPTTKAEQGETTRGQLISAGRKLFVEVGFAGASTEEIVRTAGVTRGALYHHFTDKKDLFRAVLEQVETEVTGGIGERMGGATSPYEMLRIGVGAFLDACTDPAVARISLVDAPSVLGWQEWREIDLRHGLGLVVAGLEAGIGAGEFRDQPVLPLAHLLIGAMSEAGMIIANAEDPVAARTEVEAPLLGLLDGLRI